MWRKICEDSTTPTFPSDSWRPPHCQPFWGLSQNTQWAETWGRTWGVTSSPHSCGDAIDQINFMQHLFDVNPFLGQGYFSRKLYDNIKMAKPSEGLRRPRLRAPSCATLSFLNPNAPSAESLLICHTIIFHHHQCKLCHQIWTKGWDGRAKLEKKVAGWADSVAA